MKRIHPDIDKMLWLVAESADPHAVADFSNRFPEHALELGKRIAMVRDLKGAGARATHEAVPPRFRAPAHPAGPRPRFVWALGAAALACLGVASYYLASRAFAGSAPEPKGTVSQGQPLTPETVTYRGPSYDPPKADPNSPTPAEPEIAAYLKPQSVSSAGITLSEALEIIARTCSLKLEVAPGVNEKQVSINYANMTGFEMLEDLGPRCGFTSFDEGSGKVLIIPAIEESGGASPTVKYRSNSDGAATSGAGKPTIANGKPDQ